MGCTGCLGVAGAIFIVDFTICAERYAAMYVEINVGASNNGPGTKGFGHTVVVGKHV